MIAIKICGFTSLEDCVAALQAGADWLGFNFYAPSPRSISVEGCRRIVAALRPNLERALRPVHLVGVFVGTGADEILATLDICGLELAQLSGADAMETILACQGRAYAALRTGGAVAPMAQLGALPRRASPPAALIDAGAPGQFGGTGRLADWDEAAAVAADFPIFLAGGLTPLNVGQAVQAVRPWGVDVASGVELAPGKKDAAKMAAFVGAARGIQEMQEN